MPQEETEEEAIHTNFSDLDLSLAGSYVWLEKDTSKEITQIHIYDESSQLSDHSK